MTISIKDFILDCKHKIDDIPTTILEIGAEDARDSILFKEAYPDASIWAFEANANTFNINKDKILGLGINYINNAIWNVDNESKIFHIKKSTHPGISSLRDRGQEYGTETCMVKTIRIDTFCNNNEISNIDIIKIDVEGCTYEVLDGIGELLDTVKILHIETEQQEHFAGQVLEKEVFEFLKQKGFDCDKHSFCCLSQYDSVWVKAIK